MCENCQAGIDADRQIEFLRRYLDDQRAALERNPDDKDAAGWIEKTIEVIRSLEAGR